MSIVFDPWGIISTGNIRGLDVLQAADKRFKSLKQRCLGLRSNAAPGSFLKITRFHKKMARS